MNKQSCTVVQWAEYWLEVYDKPAVRPSTLAAHRYVLKNHIIPGLGDMELSALTTEDVGRFLARCRTSGSRRLGSAGWPGLSDETMRHIHRLLYQCLARAVSEGLIPQNPARAFHYAKTKLQVQNILTAAEIETYLDAADELGVLPMFALELTAGLRLGELIALRWSDLNVQSRPLTVAKQRVVEHGRLVEYTPKTKYATRTILLPEQVVELLTEEYVRHSSSHCMFLHPGTRKPYSPNMARRLHNKIIEKAGLEHLRFLDLRHTCAALALESGMAIHVLSAALGSRPVFTKKTYELYLTGKVPESAVCERCEPSVAKLQAAADTLGAVLRI